MFGINLRRKPEEYTPNQYNTKKEEIISKLAAWCYVYDTFNLSESCIIAQISNQAEITIRELMRERIIFLQSDFYPQKIDGKNYLKSMDAHRALIAMRKAVEELIGTCITINYNSKLILNKVEKNIQLIEIEKI